MLFFPGVGSYLPNNCWHQTLQLLAGFVTPLHLSLCLVSLLHGGDGGWEGSWIYQGASKTKNRFKSGL